MKKLLLILLTFFLLVACGPSKQDEVPEEPEEEVKEPIGYRGPYYLKGEKKVDLEDLKDYKIAMAEWYDVEANDFILEDLAQYGVTEENIVKFGTFTEIPDLLASKACDYFVIDSTIEGAIEDFRQDYIADDYKVIKSYEVPYYEENPELEEIKSNYLYSNPFAVLITGIDESVPAETTRGVRTDVNILLVVNPERRHVLTIAFPRDSYMKSATYGYYTKMNGLIANSLEDTIASVGETLGIDINYFMQVSFSSFIDIINGLGGVWVHVPYDVYIDQDSHRNVAQPYSIDKGYVKLYGEWALALARNRKYAGLVGGDYGRIRNQVLIINEIMNRITEYPTLLDLIGVVWNYQNLVYTNFKDYDIKAFVQLGKEFADKGFTVDNYFIDNIGDTIEGQGFVGYMPEYTIAIAKGKIQLVMEETVDENSTYLENILTGYVSGGAGTSADGGYIGKEYDLRKVFGLEKIDVDLDLED